MLLNGIENENSKKYGPPNNMPITSNIVNNNIHQAIESSSGVFLNQTQQHSQNLKFFATPSANFNHNFSQNHSNHSILTKTLKESLDIRKVLSFSDSGDLITSTKKNFAFLNNNNSNNNNNSIINNTNNLHNHSLNAEVEVETRNGIDARMSSPITVQEFSDLLAHYKRNSSSDMITEQQKHQANNDDVVPIETSLTRPKITSMSLTNSLQGFIEGLINSDYTESTANANPAKSIAQYESHAKMMHQNRDSHQNNLNMNMNPLIVNNSNNNSVDSHVISSIKTFTPSAEIKKDKHESVSIDKCPMCKVSFGEASSKMLSCLHCYCDICVPKIIRVKRIDMKRK